LQARQKRTARIATPTIEAWIVEEEKEMTVQPAIQQTVFNT
jgi:hypothetical protein